MAIDVSKLSEKELQKLKKQVDKALDGFARKKKSEAKKAAQAAAQKFGFSLADLVSGETGAKPAARKKAASPAKYRNPGNPSQTWTGRGRKPDWFKAAVESGTDPKKMEI